jgi:hypothetical protein
MQGFQWNAASEATAEGYAASVQDMPEKPPVVFTAKRDRVTANFQTKWMLRGLAAAIFLLLQILILTPTASAIVLQANAAAPPAQTGSSSPAITDTLRPALEQVGHSVGQIQIDHWKVSKSWKEQLQSDANSISGDLSHVLPGLMQQAQATPTALDAQLRLMQNVDALYDVLVRLTLAADMNERKNDAALLDSALQNLETARKNASGQIMAAAAAQHQQLTELQARMEASQASQSASTVHGKTIVVDNEVRHSTAHHTHHKKPSSSTSSKPQSGAPPTTGKPSPQ